MMAYIAAFPRGGHHFGHSLQPYRQRRGCISAGSVGVMRQAYEIRGLRLKGSHWTLNITLKTLEV